MATIEARQAVAVCVAGQVRSATCRHQQRPGGIVTHDPAVSTPITSIQKHLLAPLAALVAHVDVFAALDAPPRRGQRLPGRMAPALMQVLSTLQPVQAALLDEADDDSAYGKLAHRSVLAPGKVDGEDNSTNYSACGALSTRLATLFTPASFGQARKLQSCFQMVVARERTVQRKYDYVIRVRPDLIFARPFNLAAYFGASRTAGTTSARRLHTRGVARRSASASARQRAPGSPPPLRMAMCTRSSALQHHCYEPCAEAAASGGGVAGTAAAGAWWLLSNATAALLAGELPSPAASHPATEQPAATNASQSHVTSHGLGVAAHGASGEADGSYGRVERRSTVVDPSDVADGEEPSTDFATVRPFVGMLSATYLHDHFYVARRAVADPLFDHLSIIESQLIEPTRDRFARWSKSDQRADRKSDRGHDASGKAEATNKASATQASSRSAYCRRVLGTIQEVLASPAPCPSFHDWLGGVMPPSSARGPWRCRDARIHECALALGVSLAHHRASSHSSSAADPANAGATIAAPRRTRYLHPADWPQLLRLQDTAEGSCDAAREAYACAERELVRAYKVGGSASTTPGTSLKCA